MTKMTKAQRTAILDAHTYPGQKLRGLIMANRRTIAVLKREGWAEKWIDDESAWVTFAGLIDAGVDMDALHEEAKREDEAREGFVMTEGMAAILRSASPVTGFIDAYVGAEEDAMIRKGMIRRDKEGDYFILEFGVQCLGTWESMCGAPGDLTVPQVLQALRDEDHAEALNAKTDAECAAELADVDRTVRMVSPSGRPVSVQSRRVTERLAAGYTLETQEVSRG